MVLRHHPTYYRFWLRIFSSVLAIFVCWNVFTWVESKQTIPEYKEPLNEQQLRMKEEYLSKRIIPDVVTLKDGRTIYYIPNSPFFETEKPEWLSGSGELVLTNDEKWQVAREALVSVNLFGINTKQVTASNLQTTFAIASITCMFGFFYGFMAILAIYRKEIIPIKLLLLLAFLFAPIFYHRSIESFLIIFGAFCSTFMIILSLWPIWTLTDRAVDRKSIKEGTFEEDIEEVR